MSSRSCPAFEATGGFHGVQKLQNRERNNSQVMCVRRGSMQGRSQLSPMAPRVPALLFADMMSATTSSSLSLEYRSTRRWQKQQHRPTMPSRPASPVINPTMSAGAQGAGGGSVGAAVKETGQGSRPRTFLNPRRPEVRVVAPLTGLEYSHFSAL